MDDKSLDRSTELAYLPPVSPPRNHGHTMAAWVTVGVVVVGSLVAALAVMAGEAWLFWLGIAIVVVGAVVGRVLKMLGFGQPGPDEEPRDSGRAHH